MNKCTQCGNPSGKYDTCNPCFEKFDLQTDDIEQEDFLTKLLENPTVSKLLDRAVGNINERIDKVGERVDQKIDQYAQIALMWFSQQGQQKAAQQAKAGPSPREVLGFDPGVKLTREMVKKRQRELVRIYHSDVSGGNSEEMIRKINTAVDELLKDL